MAIAGLVDYAVDPDVGAVIPDEWCLHLAAMGVSHVKVAIATARDGHLPTDLYKRAADTYGRHGIDVLPMLAAGFAPVDTGHPVYPNMPRYSGPGTNHLLSPFVDGWTLRAEGFVKQLAPHGWKRWVLWNEPNVLPLKEGDPTPSDPAKSWALSPQVTAALWWQGAHRLKAAGATRVYCGALSVLPTTGLDGRNPYYAAWVKQMYATLDAEGQHGAWPWDGWSTNSEGWWDAAGFGRALAVLDAIRARHNDGGPTLVGEWGQKCSALAGHTDQAQATFTAFDTLTAAHYFFQGPGRVPYIGDPALYGDYGAYQWRILGTQFFPQPEYAWGPVLRNLIKSRIPELTGYGSVMVEQVGGEWHTVAPGGWRFVTPDQIDGYGPMSADLPELDAVWADLKPGTPYKVLRPGKAP